MERRITRGEYHTKVRTFALGHVVDFVPLLLNLVDSVFDVIGGVVTRFHQIVSGLSYGVDPSLIRLQLSVEVLMLLRLALKRGRIKGKL